MSDRLTILMTSGAGPGVVGHVDAARRNGFAPVHMIVGDVSPDENIGFALADEHVHLPRAGEQELIEELLILSARYDVDVVWPVFDGELEPLAAARERFGKKGVRLLLPDEATVRLCLDKAEFYRQLAGSGLAPTAWPVTDVETLKEAAAACGYPARPVVIKPVRATGGRGFHVVRGEGDSGVSFFSARADHTTCTLDDVVVAMRQAPEGQCPAMLVMSYLGGEEIGVDVMAARGAVVAAVTRKKLPPIKDGMHTRIVIDEEAEALEVTERLVERIGADGLLSVDLRRDGSGELQVLEVNPRAGAYLGMACMRIDLFGLALSSLYELPLDAAECRRATRPMVGLRYWADRVLDRGIWRRLGDCATDEMEV